MPFAEIIQGAVIPVMVSSAGITKTVGETTMSFLSAASLGFFLRGSASYARCAASRAIEFSLPAAGLKDTRAEDFPPWARATAFDGHVIPPTYRDNDVSNCGCQYAEVPLAAMTLKKEDS